MKNRIAKIYDLLSRIPVNGDSVDVMATVRAELRALHKVVLAQEAKDAKASRDKEAALEADRDPNGGKEEDDG